ncbi:MAG: hypothetical protein JST14_01925 [Bacteroidetes bacterium]|nr:hypothetical protein [Bacteroidota bacterium]MBS1978541.1 hypothetical protein [Bacteroidota bacterium]
MYSKSWLIIRDDNKKTFEVTGQESNTNHFTNLIQAMQRSGMNVTGLTPPVGGKFPSRDSIKFVGLTNEPGLYARMLKEYHGRLGNDLDIED